MDQYENRQAICEGPADLLRRSLCHKVAGRRVCEKHNGRRDRKALFVKASHRNGGVTRWRAEALTAVERM